MNFIYSVYKKYSPPWVFTALIAFTSQYNGAFWQKVMSVDKKTQNKTKKNYVMQNKWMQMYSPTFKVTDLLAVKRQS